jgi:SPP1 family predicted phage head-tail adaptor
MRAGSLDRTIVVERVTTEVSDEGAPVQTWAALVTLRAERLDATMDEQSGQGTTTTRTTVVFRTRFFDGVTPADRLAFDGGHYDIRAVKEIGRSRGLELTAEGP